MAIEVPEIVCAFTGRGESAFAAHGADTKIDVEKRLAGSGKAAQREQRGGEKTFYRCVGGASHGTAAWRQVWKIAVGIVL